MNKLVIGITIALFVIISGVSAYIILNDKSGTTPTTNGNGTTSGTTAAAFTACDILTEDIAKSLLGDEIDHPAGGLGDASTTDLAVTTCNYATKISAAEAAKDGLPKSDGLSLLARVAKTPAGAESNRQLFNAFPAGVEEVKGIGDKAFYSSDFHQLNVLKGDNWYVVTYYIGTVTNATLETDKKLAEKLSFR